MQQSHYVLIQNITIPMYFALIILEVIYAKRVGKLYVMHSIDSLASLVSGTTFLIKSVLGLTFSIVSYGWLVDQISLFRIESTISIYCIAFIGIDFAFYWYHRIMHRVNYFWNQHIVHHSSEEFNLACALRQPVSNFITPYVVLLLPLALLGIPMEVIAFITPIHLAAQFWYHTRLIGKLGFLEKIIVTPSHHRVHHAINDTYMDKNLSAIFIIWDKLFGTFQEEIEGKPPVYGVKKPVRTWNPFSINFQHLFMLVKDAWRARSWFDKLRIWFMPTGWRPEDVKLKYPIQTLSDDDFDNYDKYAPEVSREIKIWSWFQYSLLLLLVSHFMNNISQFSLSHGLLYATFLYLSVYAITSLMEKNEFAWLIELTKAAFGLGIIAYSHFDWFFLSSISISLVIILGIYLLLSPMIVFLLSARKINALRPV